MLSRFKLSNLNSFSTIIWKASPYKNKISIQNERKVKYSDFHLLQFDNSICSLCVQIFFQYYSYLKVMAILHPGRTKWRYIFSLLSGIFTRSSFYIIILQCLYDLFSCLNARTLWSKSQQKQCCQNNLPWDSTHVILVSFRGLLLYELGDAQTTLAGRQSCRWLDWDCL